MQSSAPHLSALKNRLKRFISYFEEAKQAMKAHVKQRLIAEQAASQEKLAARHAQEQSTGKATAPPKKGPRDKDQYNFADPASRIMKMRGGSEQCYNAQAVVEVTKMRI